jgi:uncharacterized protein (DUF433 family)
MSREELLSRISVDPNICFGKPCIRGHRIWVALILDLLASGSTIAQILADYPGLEEADVLACLAYGAEMSRERFVDIPDLKLPRPAQRGEVAERSEAGEGLSRFMAQGSGPPPGGETVKKTA